MSEELKQQVEAEAGATPEGVGTAGATSSEPTTETTGAPELKAQIEAAIQKVREEYESKGGHLAKLRSKYDTKIAELERQLRQQTKSRTDEALALMDKDPVKAGQLLAGIVQQQAEAATHDAKRQELITWQRKIMEDLGYDLETEEGAELAAGWTAKILENPDEAWNFHQDVAMQAAERERKARQSAEKDLQEMKDGLPALIEAQVTRSLVSAGIVPDTSAGGAPAEREQDWRKEPEGTLLRQGLAERAKRPIKRT